MLTRDEASEIAYYGCCTHEHGQDIICENCRHEIAKLLKQSPADQPRKIIELKVLANKDGFNYIFVRCNDGTLWATDPNEKNQYWEKIPPIPQGDA
jgi:hypothetical protein